MPKHLFAVMLILAVTAAFGCSQQKMSGKCPADCPNAANCPAACQCDGNCPVAGKDKMKAESMKPGDAKQEQAVCHCPPGCDTNGQCAAGCDCTSHAPKNM